MNTHFHNPTRPRGRSQIHNAVLIVDDDRTNRHVLSRTASQAGLTSITATDGVQAYELLQTRRFRAVITDYEMPRMSGLELLNTIRQSNRRDLVDIPVIVVSSVHSQRVTEQITPVPSTYFLPKPIHVGSLKSLLRMVSAVGPNPNRP